MDPVPASIPFHVAEAYGLGSRPSTQIEAKGGTPKTSRNGVIATASGLRVTPMNRPASGLVAASVQGQVRFDTVDTRAAKPTSGESFQLYRHPADRNAAATAIDSGRRIDMQA